MENSCTVEKRGYNKLRVNGEILIPARNIRLLDLNHIIDQSSPEIISMIDSMKLLHGDQISLKSKIIKQVFYHVIIKNICDSILESNGSSSSYIYYCRNQSKSRLLYQYVSRDELLIFLNTALNRIQSILPIRLVRHSIQFSDIPDIIDENNGDLEELIHLLENHDENFRRRMDCKFTFSPALRFAKKYGLQYLEKDYLIRIKTRNLMFS